MQMKKTMARSIHPKKPGTGSYKSSLIYGLSGTGKTTFAATMPKPLLVIDIKERGHESITDVEGVEVEECDTWADVENALEYVKEDTKYKTIVIDTITSMSDVRISQTTGGRMSLKYGSISRQQWGAIAADLKNIIYDLKGVDDKNIVYLAHMKTFDVEEGEDSEDIPARNARTMPSVLSVLNGAVDIILNTFIMTETHRIKEKTGNRVKTTTKRVPYYCMRVGPNPLYVTKIRTPRHVEKPAFIKDPKWDDIVALMKGSSNGTTRSTQGKPKQVKAGLLRRKSQKADT